ncbi:trypsin-like peptidase domain-containing protein [Aestuariibacter sp. AA17]|uniref:Trypsin-like peptidase domain-containing protein n=1 Tax=Fluctibacter corallii TaxID=2984329 RepID=A0ABT3A4P8_9ALTE|nr:trypsin-like peptidase domain-containing protein [Aestuariibacter sp. AA17]MCV2883646.1 trypsin-like peptidase domain-containing protein [Aestuariibacter sp. AA17]
MLFNHVKLPSWITFILRSALLGVIISVLMLLLVPELRRGSGITLDWFAYESSAPEKLSYYNAVSHAAPAVVNIYSNSIDVQSSLFTQRSVERTRTSLGSGVIMTENGHILTCLHVIQNAETIFVGLPDGQLAAADLVGQDIHTDLAVLKIDVENLHVIPQLDDPDTRVGDVVLAIGNPLNLGQTITQGIVSRIGRNISSHFIDFIQTDAVLNEGNSGGALVDSNGYLIGINNANFKTVDNRRRLRDVDGVFFAVPYKLARRVMDEIIATGRATHGVLGFSATSMPNTIGIVINTVFPGGPSEQAGLQPDDVIMAIDGVAVKNVYETLDKVASSTPGTILTLEVRRNGETLNLPVTVAELGQQ